MFRELAQWLDEWNCYAFNFIESNNRVAEYVGQIKRIQPIGPYHFLAYSAGGSLAYSVIEYMRDLYDDEIALILLDSKLERIWPRLTDEALHREAEQIINFYLDRIGMLDMSRKDNLRSVRLGSVVSYLRYIQEIVYDEPISAEVHRIEADHAKWDDHDLQRISVKGYATYQGYGPHLDMIRGAYAKQNAELLLRILKTRIFSGH